MKNYTTDELKMETFIESYQPNGEEFIIKYADGENSTVSRSIENEKMLLEKMKQQVLESEKYKQEIIDVIKICKFIILLVFVVGTLGISLISLLFAKNIIDILQVGIATLLFTSPAYLGMGITIRDQKELLKDIEKNQTFLQNEILFQTKITKDINIPSNTKKETQQVINTIVKIKEKDNRAILRPTINDIDNISYDIFMDLFELINEEKKINQKKKSLKKTNSTIKEKLWKIIHLKKIKTLY